jgi:glycosyltransferase involved in cell wall biosynthesis
MPRSNEPVEQRVAPGLARLIREIRQGDRVLVWAHNLGLGRNLYLSRGLMDSCHGEGIRLVAHHHDWWFENRWHHFAALKDSGFQTLRGVAAATLFGSPQILHVAINQADAAVLKKHFRSQAGWLPNPVELEPKPPLKRVAAARTWLGEQIEDNAPIWLLPCRLLRRKNIAEALLLTRWLRPQAWLVTTGAASSAEEQPYAETLLNAALRHGWRLRLGIMQGDESQKPTVPELMAASEAVMLTSLQEGFGLPFLEAAAAGRPLVARRLPGVAPDLAKFGFKFPQAYREVMVDPSLFDWRKERRRQAHLFAAWKASMPPAAARLVGKPTVLAAGANAVPVAFSRLTLTAQLEVLTVPSEDSWGLCVGLNPFLKRWRKRAAKAALETSPWPRSATRWLSGRAYAQRFSELTKGFCSGSPSESASKAAQGDFLRKKLCAENLYPLLWQSRS